MRRHYRMAARPDNLACIKKYCPCDKWRASPTYHVHRRRRPRVSTRFVGRDGCLDKIGPIVGPMRRFTQYDMKVIRRHFAASAHHASPRDTFRRAIYGLHRRGGDILLSAATDDSRRAATSDQTSTTRAHTRHAPFKLARYPYLSIIRAAAPIS